MKKMVIKPFKKKPSLPPDFEETTWAKMRAAVHAVFAATATSYSREELYRAVEDLCMHKMAARLFERLYAECEANVASLVDSLAGRTPEVIAFLNLANAAWERHCSQIVTIRSIFLHLDRTFVVNKPSVRSLWEMGLQLFRRHLDRQEGVKRKLVSGLLELIERERRGETINRSLMRSLLRMFVQLKIYAETFEGEFLVATGNFYREEGDRYMAETAVAKYLLHVETRLQEETNRAVAYLDDATARPLIAVLEHELLVRHTDGMLDKGLDDLLTGTRIEDLQRMYRLLGRADGLEVLGSRFADHAKARGLEIVQDTAKEKEREMVQNLLDLKEVLDRILAEAFGSDESFSHALRSAFEAIVNARQERPAQLIARFVDAQLRSGGPRRSDAEVEILLDRVMVLFRAINGKDTFAEFYRNHLAKRLLLARSASDELEKSMISRLKTECGAGFTKKMEGMFADVEISKGLMSQWKATTEYAAILPTEVHVLTTTYWPSAPAPAIKLPPQLAAAQEAFAKFYHDKFSGRRLTWQPAQAHCIVRGFFKNGTKELQLSLFQAMVLVLFNENERMTYPELVAATGMDDKTLKPTLLSLSMAKGSHVLIKDPKSKDCKPTDAFSVNAGFRHKLRRIKINSIQIRETAAEEQEAYEHVFRDRQHAVDAAIVRTMKTRKTLSHQLLLAELFSQLKFPVK